MVHQRPGGPVRAGVRVRHRRAGGLSLRAGPYRGLLCGRGRTAQGRLQNARGTPRRERPKRVAGFPRRYLSPLIGQRKHRTGPKAREEPSAHVHLGRRRPKPQLAVRAVLPRGGPHPLPRQCPDHALPARVATTPAQCTGHRGGDKGNHEDHDRRRRARGTRAGETAGETGTHPAPEEIPGSGPHGPGHETAGKGSGDGPSFGQRQGTPRQDAPRQTAGPQETPRQHPWPLQPRQRYPRHRGLGDILTRHPVTSFCDLIPSNARHAGYYVIFLEKREEISRPAVFCSITQAVFSSFKKLYRL